MTKVKLVDGSVINAESVELVNGVLKIITTEGTVEELAEAFGNAQNTALITFLTESEIESGYKCGFTVFTGINYTAEGVKTVELCQPVDVTEARVANAEGTAAEASNKASEVEATVNTLLGV